ncbi:MAG: membrane protein insertase YidC [Actinomycetota bacterium]
MGFFELFAGALAAFYALIPSFGIAIILLTIAVRILLLPLSIKQTKSMREMQVIQPEVKKIQQKHKNDRQKLNEETMKLYKEHGVNPFGGCLPLLMQMPLFIGLYQVVRLNLRYMGFRVSDSVAAGFVPIAGATGLLAALQTSKLAQDLLDPIQRETVNQFLPGLRLDCNFLQAWRGVGTETVQASCGAGNPFLSALPYLLLIAIMGFTTYYQQRQLMAGRGPQDQQAQQMQMVMRFMPILLMAFAIGIPIGPGFPAGVVLYWVTTNAWTIVQQRIILARLGPAPAVAASATKSGAKSKKTDERTGTDGKADAKADGKQTGPAPKTSSKPRGKKTQSRQSGNGSKSPARSGSNKKKRRR